MGEICNNVGLPKNVLETASMIYRDMDACTDVKGKSRISISAAAIYMACKQCDVMQSLEGICKSTCIPEDVKQKTRLATKYYRDIVMDAVQVTAPVVSIDRYISKIANMTQTEAEIVSLAREISKAIDSNVTDGKDPNGIAAAYLYVASVLLGQNILQKDISIIAGVSEGTVRIRYREILACHKFNISLKPC